MTRTEFNSRFAATPDNWFDPETLDELNDRAFAFLADLDVSEYGDATGNDDRIEQLVKGAFDRANNDL